MSFYCKICDSLRNSTEAYEGVPRYYPLFLIMVKGILHCSMCAYDHHKIVMNIGMSEHKSKFRPSLNIIKSLGLVFPEDPLILSKISEYLGVCWGCISKKNTRCSYSFFLKNKYKYRNKRTCYGYVCAEHELVCECCYSSFCENCGLSSCDTCSKNVCHDCLHSCGEFDVCDFCAGYR
jgi:hypothetical protein